MFPDFNFLNNTDLLSVGVAIAAIGILAFVVYFNNRQSITSKTFLMFSLVTAFWGVVNYLSYRFPTADGTLILLRLVLFFAVLQAFTLYQFFYVYPKEQIKFSRAYKLYLLPITFITALLTLTPLVFTNITGNFVVGSVAKVQKGPGILIFAVVAIGLVISAVYQLVKKLKASSGEEKSGIRLIFFGTILMFALIITLNFIVPAFYDNQRYIPLGALFTLPFVFFTAYAIIRHQFLNTKVISTEILVFVLAIATLFEVIISQDFTTLILRSSIFLLVLSVGVLLVRSVVREVKQREELEVLSKQLAEANEQLKALDKARAEFISIASHQLRTPPATIKWYVGAILNGDFGPLSEELKAALLRTNVTNEAQISTIDDLLNASRIERGKLEFFFEMGNIAPMLKTLVEQLEPLAQMKKQHLVYTPPTTPIPDILVDNEKVRQVINNMVDNAIKYSKKGDIHISLELDSATDPQNVVVKVKDTGKGIEPSEIEGLFQKYSRGKDSATHATGLGLGMYVAKVIIEQHNGKIWAESEGIGKGATFAFSLPIHSKIQPTSTVDLTKSLG